jgi:hypothetical protein
MFDYRIKNEDNNMDAPDLTEPQQRIETLRQRLVDIALYLKGIAAVVEGLNKGAADAVEIAIHAVEAASADLEDTSICLLRIANTSTTPQGDGVDGGVPRVSMSDGHGTHEATG